MKRSAFHHSKMKLLMARLKIRRYAAIGILESLWDLTENEAPRGDIGRLSDERIAISLDWEREPKDLIDGLEFAGWIDVHPEHRYIVHDWPEHCEDAVDAKVFRMGTTFADGTQPRGKKVSGKEKASITKRKSGPALIAVSDHGQLKESEDFTPTQVATAVIQEANASGSRALMALTDVAKPLMAAGMKADDCRKLLLDRWQEYTKAASDRRLKWTYSSIEKFFSGGIWNKPSMWPWKEGQEPQQKVGGKRLA
jgi:hypothetical protein